MFVQSNNMLCGYQYGANIADLFAGIPGNNTIFGTGSCSGLGTGGLCCNSSPKTIWGMILGTGASIAASIGISWGVQKIQTKQAEKVAAAKREQLDAESLNNAMKTLGLNDKTTEEVLSMSKDDIDKIKIKSDYDDKALKRAKSAVSTYKDSVTKETKNITNAIDNITTLTAEKNKLNTELSAAKSSLPEDKNSDAYKEASKKIENLKDQIKEKEKEIAAETTKKSAAETAKKQAEKNLADAEKTLKDIEEKRSKFNDAKRTVKEAIEKENNRKANEYRKNNKPSMGV